MLRYIVRMIAVRIKYWWNPELEMLSKTGESGWYDSKDFLNQVKEFEDEGRAGKLNDKGGTT